MIGGSEMLIRCRYSRYIFKTIKVAEKTDFCNLLSPSWRVPCGQRSKGRVRRKKISSVPNAENDEVRTVEESKSQGHFAAHPRKPRNIRRKRKAEPTDSEVICQRSFPSRGESRRMLNRSTMVIQKSDKLDSRKFEDYMENIWRGFTEEKRNKFTYLDSLWFSLYAKEPSKAKVLSWIKRKDIFSKRYVFVPIVQWGHWFLLIFCHFGESPHSKTGNCCMLLLDSLQRANSKQLEPGIRRFVLDIYKTEERLETKDQISKIPLLIPKVPQQRNAEECGFCVLYYINLFLERAPDSFSLSMGYPYFMKEDWFTSEEMECFVNRLDSLTNNADCSNK